MLFKMESDTKSREFISNQASSSDKLATTQLQRENNSGRKLSINRLVIVVLLVLVLMLAAAFGGYKWENNRAAKIENGQQAKIANLNSQLGSLQNVSNSNEYLKIKEWSVKLPLASDISGAAYTIMNNSWDNHPTAFLSTAALDNSTSCQQYYASDPIHPSFQWLVQYALTDTVYPEETPGSTMTAQKAVTQYPNTYKQVGSYVYAFGHGNGFPCPEESLTMVNAFQTAFDSLKLAN